jgi:hypothetical protein
MRAMSSIVRSKARRNVGGQAGIEAMWRYGAFQHVHESFAHAHASRRRKSIAAYVTGFIECSWREGRKSVSFRDAQDGK